ncbi:probable serine/threonine-protein kinase clkA [Galleria mellonella]|uniref:Probable serine/threonine-protein kinase clkA n=1 Tax=Galleria mellonella TaxID=7137 RepID=A0ABM3M914_GALME|nr:probable serine/threonine-protein kinase clkA [Galleria mellonella]
MKLLKLSLIYIASLQLCQTLENHGVRKKRNHEYTRVVNDHNPIIQIGNLKERPRFVQAHTIPINVLPQNIYNLKQIPMMQTIPKSVNPYVDKDLTRKAFIPIKTVQLNNKIPVNLVAPEKKEKIEKNNEIKNNTSTEISCKYKKHDYFENDIDVRDKKSLQVKIKLPVSNTTNQKQTTKHYNKDSHDTDSEYLLRNVDIRALKVKANSSIVKTKLDRNINNDTRNVTNNGKESVKNATKSTTDVVHKILKSGNNNLNSKANMDNVLTNSKRKENNTETKTMVNDNNLKDPDIETDVNRKEKYKLLATKPVTTGSEVMDKIKFVVNIDSNEVKSFQCDPSDRIVIKNRNYEEIIEKQNTPPAQIDYQDDNYYYKPENTYDQEYFNGNVYDTMSNTNSYRPDITFIKSPYEYPFADQINYEELYRYKQNDAFSRNCEKKIIPNDRIWRKWNDVKISVQTKDSDEPVDSKMYTLNENQDNNAVNEKVYQRMLDNNNYYYRYKKQNNNMKMTVYPCYLYPHNNF